MKDEKIVERLEDGSYFVQLLKEYYEKEAVFAAADQYTHDFYVKIDSLDMYVGIWFSAKDTSATDDDVRIAIQNFCNEAIHQQLCRDLDKQYGGLRDKIYSYAFEPIEG